MHYIQKHILDTLRREPTLHYAELNTIDIESGHFRYHLRELMKNGLVAQQQRGVYSLTTEGQHMVDRLSSKQGAPHAMPKVITYTLLHNGDTIYLQRKAKEPYRGLFNMIGGKLHEGETPASAAIREVQEKTGIEADHPVLQGVFNIQISHDDQLLTHAIAYVYRIEVADDLIDDVAGLEKCNLHDLARIQNPAPDLLPILQSLEKSTAPLVSDIQIDL